MGCQRAYGDHDNEWMSLDEVLPQNTIVIVCEPRGLIIVYSAAMTHGNDQHYLAVLLNLTDDSVIPDSVTPEALLGMTQRVAKLMGSSDAAIRVSM